mgnify:CR=1 FL=1
MRNFIYISPEGETRKRALNNTFCKEEDSTHTYTTDSAKNTLLWTLRIKVFCVLGCIF